MIESSLRGRDALHIQATSQPGVLLKAVVHSREHTHHRESLVDNEQGPGIVGGSIADSLAQKA